MRGPDSVSWRIGRETVLILGGRRALLLQLAHPLVAQGVADHSNFRNDRFGRLLRTVDLSLTIVFGETEEAAQAIEQIKAVHRSVTGTLSENVGVYGEGTPYSANDPDLLLWVHATLVDTAVEFYNRFVRLMTDAEAEGYYEETLWPASLIGIPEQLLPQSFKSFREYWADMLASGHIAVGAVGMEMGEAILYPNLPWLPRRLLDPLNLITIGTLPPEVRSMYRLRWNPARAAALRAASAAVPMAIRLLPPRLRYVPHAFKSDRVTEPTLPA
jgi:uncharacterized protein (DUF2236 family)